VRTEQKSSLKSNIGRLLFVFMSFVLQISWFVLLFVKLSEYSPYFTLFYSLLTFIIVIKIYGRPMNAAFKMPWIIIIMAFPILGICIYLLFGRGGVSGRIKKKFADIEKRFAVHTTQNEAVMAELKVTDMYMANQSRYLLECAGYPVYKNTDIKYYKDASDGFEAQLRELEKAEKFIFMEYHAIEEAEAFARLEKVLVKKAKEGVEVRLFYDDMGSIAFVNKDFIKKMRSEGIECRVFNPVMTFFNLFMNNRDHRKITVIDNRVGFTGGYNLADEYFNITHPYGYWKDTGIRLEGEAVKSLTRMFLEMWNGMKKTDTDYEKYFSGCSGDYVSVEKGFAQPYADSPLDNEKVGENVYLNLIQYATQKIYIATPYLIISDEMQRMLVLAAKKGVDVRIVTPGIPDKKLVYKMTRSYYAGLAEAGVRIFEYTPGFMHAKQFMCDGKAAAIGTINMDYRSLYHHFENGVLFYNYEAIKDMEADFKEMFEVSCEVTAKYADNRSAILKLGQCILRLAAPLL